jgi:aminoglycoside 6-adenylyltransferase
MRATESQSDQLLLQRIKDWSKANDNVVALIMTGSHARGDNRVDQLSDLDLEIIADQPSGLANDNSWFSQFDNILVSQAFNEGQEYPTRLVFYEGGTKVDFTLASTKRLTDMIQNRRLDGLYERGYRVIIDKRGITKDLPAPSGQFPIVTGPTQAEFTAAVEEFWFEAAHIPRYLSRNELWVTKFRDWTIKENLLKMLEWHAIVTRKEPIDVWYIGSHMEEWVDPEIWRELRSVFSHFDPKDSWRGLLATINVFRRLATETANRAGLDYPNEIDRCVTGYIKSFEGRF